MRRVFCLRGAATHRAARTHGRMATVGCAEGIVHINIPKLGERGAESRNLFLGGLEPFELFPFLPLLFHI